MSKVGDSVRVSLSSGIGLLFLIAGYVTWVLFLVVEEGLRETRNARSLRRGTFDRGSTLLVGWTFGIGLCLPVVTSLFRIAVFQVDLALGVAGISIMIYGLFLRIWSVSTLGRFYTRTLMIAEVHRVVTNGPYSRIRHPGYLGVILLWVGFGLLSGSVLVTVLLPLASVAVYVYRISVEERMLVNELGDDYTQYQRKTRRLIPFVY